MDPFGNDDNYTRLKHALDINDLRDPDSQGVEFEVDETDLANEGDKETDTDLRCFDKKKIVANLCLLSENEKGDAPGNEDDEDFVSEKDRLHKYLLKLPAADITPAKDGGVLKDTKAPGVGPLVAEGALVCFHYNAYVDVGEPPFDSSRLRNEYAKLRLGKGLMVPGLEVALQSMRKKESARFLIHHSYAYGKMGCPPRIPQETSLIYDVEVVYFVEQEGVDDYASMTEEERRRCPWIIMEKTVKALNEEGKQNFAKKEFVQAVKKYAKSERILETYHLKSDEEEAKMRKELLRVYTNCALCSSKLRQFGRVVSYCNKALQLHRQHGKAHYLKGKALHAMGSFEDAKRSLNEAKKISPNDQDIIKALKALEEAMKEHHAFEKDLFAKMLSKPTGETEKKDLKKESEKPDPEKCSDEFSALVQSKLQDFKEDRHQSEMKFPYQNMSPGEIACIIEAAEALGLSYRSRGQGSTLHYEIVKNP